MKRTIIALSVFVIFATGLMPALGAVPAKKAPAKPPVAQKQTTSAVCPVMGTKIPDVKKAPGGKSVYKGKTYYFCCPACKPMFEKNPEKYIKKQAGNKAPTTKAAPKKK